MSFADSRWCGVVLAVALTANAGLHAAVTDAEWKSGLEAFKVAWDGGNRVAAVRVLSQLDDLRAAKHLESVIGTDDAMWAVLEAIADGLGGMSDLAVCKYVSTRASTHSSVLARYVLCRALARMTNPDARKALDALLVHKDADLRCASVRGLGLVAAGPDVPALLIALADKAAPVRQAAIEALVRAGDVRAVAPLVECLDKETGYLRADARRALIALTGEQPEAAGWRERWTGTPSPALPGGAWATWMDGTKTSTALPLDKIPERSPVPIAFGIPVYSRRIAFVVQCSGRLIDPIKGKTPRVTLTVGAGKRQVLDLTDAVTAWDVVRAHVVFALRQLDPQTQFSLIVFRDVVMDPATAALVPATPSNVEAAIARLESKRPAEAANVYDALRAGLADGGNPAELRRRDKEPDTVFFVGTGWATTGTIMWKKPGARTENELWGEQLVTAVRTWNFVRQTRIYCVGVSSYARDTLHEPLALATGGEAVSLNAPGSEGD